MLRVHLFDSLTQYTAITFSRQLTAYLRPAMAYQYPQPPQNPSYQPQNANPYGAPGWNVPNSEPGGNRCFALWCISVSQWFSRGVCSSPSQFPSLVS